MVVTTTHKINNQLILRAKVAEAEAGAGAEVEAEQSRCQGF